MKVTILIPCYNENENIKLLKVKLTPVLKDIEKLGFDYELMFIDDGSTDDTWKKINQLFGKNKKVRLIKHKFNQNLSGCLKTAIKEAKGELLIAFDADCSYNPKDIVNLLRKQKKTDADVVIASVYHPKGKVNGLPKYRLIPSFTASWLYRKLTKSKIYTYTGLFRLYKLSKLREIEIETYGFISLAEILVKLIRKNATIVEYPCSVGVRIYNHSKMKFFQTTKAHLNLMSKIILGKY